MYTYKKSRISEEIAQEHNLKTFSVAIYEEVPTKNGKGTKKGPTKVRVIGPLEKYNEVIEFVESAVQQLNDGTYTGPKNKFIK